MPLTYCHRCATLKPQGHKHHAPDLRPPASRRGYGSKWRQARTDYLYYFPICQWQEGCINPATQVHHLDGLGPEGPRGYDWGNLQGLCASHHSRTTATEQPGGFNA